MTTEYLLYRSLLSICPFHDFSCKATYVIIVKVLERYVKNYSKFCFDLILKTLYSGLVTARLSWFSVWLTVSTHLSRRTLNSRRNTASKERIVKLSNYTWEKFLVSIKGGRWMKFFWLNLKLKETQPNMSLRTDLWNVSCLKGTAMQNFSAVILMLIIFLWI